MTGIGVIGAGRLGQAMVSVALRAGRSFVIANGRGPESLSQWSPLSGTGFRRAVRPMPPGLGSP
jgi:predicted dinucleotide-binding enzyme